MTESKLRGAEMIAAERERQIAVERYDAAHDEGHYDELLDAAKCYLRFGTYKPSNVPFAWPWRAEFWKPSDDPIRNLAKAGALIAAAIDSLEARS